MLLLPDVAAAAAAAAASLLTQKYDCMDLKHTIFYI